MVVLAGEVEPPNRSLGAFAAPDGVQREAVENRPGAVEGRLVEPSYLSAGGLAGLVIEYISRALRGMRPGRSG